MGSDRISALATRLWRQRAVRQAAFWTGLVLHVAMLGVILGFALAPSGNQAIHRHIPVAAVVVHPVADKDTT